MPQFIDVEKGGVCSIMSDAGDVLFMAQTWKEATGNDIKLISASDKDLIDLVMAGKEAM